MSIIYHSHSHACHVFLTNVFNTRDIPPTCHTTVFLLSPNASHFRIHCIIPSLPTNNYHLQILSISSKMTATIIKHDITLPNTESIDENDASSRNKILLRPQHDAASLPGLIRIHSDCGSCPFCPDVCLNADCGSCMEKTKLMNEKLHMWNRTMSRTSPETPTPFRLFSSPKPGEKETYITPCQLKRHNTMNSAWLLCGEIVYDATDYINGHPGGEKSILRKSGGAFDCSKDMKFHSKFAINVWKRNKIGILKPCPGECGIIESENDNIESCVIS